MNYLLPTSQKNINSLKSTGVKSKKSLHKRSVPASSPASSAASLSTPVPASIPAPKPTPKKITTIKHSHAAHLLSMPAIIKRSLEGEQLEGSNPIELFPKIREIIEEAVKEGAPAPGEAFYKAMDQVIETCEAASKLCSSSMPLPEQTTAFAEMMKEKLSALHIGESYTVSGGWMGRKNSGHAMLYKFEKTNEDSFTITIYNSGAGLNYHPSITKPNGQRRFLTSLPFTKVPLESAINPDFWAAHYQMNFGKPEGENFDEKLLYEKLFPVLIPHFEKRFGGDQDIEKAHYLREQTGGVCGAQSLLILLREATGEDFHQLRDKVRVCALKQHCNTLESQKLLITESDQKEAPSVEDLAKRKGAIQFLEKEVQRVAGDVQRDTTKRAKVLNKPQRLASVQENFAIMKQVAEKVAEATSFINQQCSILSAFNGSSPLPFSRPWFTPPTPPIPSITQEPSPLVGSKLLFEAPVWPTDSKEVLIALASWVKLVGVAFNEGPQADEGIHLWLIELFRTMPSFNEKPWTTLPLPMQMPCMRLLSSLSNVLVRTHLSLEDRLVSQSTVEASLTKINAIILALARQMPHSKAMNIPSHSTIIGDQNYEKVQWRKNAGFFLSDPKLNREYCEAISLIANSKKSDSWFQELRNLKTDYILYPYEVTRTKCCAYGRNLENSSDEMQWMSMFLDLAENAEVLKKIKEALRDKFTGDQEKDQCLIIAEAIANAQFYFPDNPFWIVQQQAILDLMVQRKPRPEWAQSLQNGAARNQALFKCGLDLKKLPSAILSFSFAEEPSKPLLMNQQNDGLHYPTPNLSQFFSDICQEWSEPSSNSKSLRLYGPQREALKQLPKETQELISLVWTEDPQHRAMKVIAYFKQHMALLKDPVHQWILKSCLFSPGVLHNQLSQSSFIHSLEEFVQFGYLQAKSDLSTALFFLHLGDKLQKNCLALYPQFLVNFPTISNFQELRRLEEAILQSEASDTQKKMDQALLSATVLANYGNGALLWQKDAEALLAHAFRFAAYKTLNRENIPLDLIEEAAEGSKQLVNFIKTFNKNGSKECSKVLTQAVASFTKHPELRDLEWKGFDDSFPVIYTSRREVQIDLLSGQVWVGASQEDMIPNAILKSPTFSELFPDITALSGITSSPALTLFRDKTGAQYKAWVAPDKNVLFARNIDGIWHNYVASIPDPLPISKVLNDQCTCWIEPSTPLSKVRFLDKTTGKVRYIHDYQKMSLEWLHGDSSKPSLYSIHKGVTDIEKFFADFDPQPQLWANEAGRLTVIELPNYHLFFDVTYSASGEPMITSREHPGYRLAIHQYLPQFLQSPGYLILTKPSQGVSAEKDQERILLMPKRSLRVRPELTNSLIQDWTSYNYFVYSLNAKGELTQPTDLEARLYLANLYTKLGEYRQAEKLLFLPHESVSLGPYSAEALAWLNDIAQGMGLQQTIAKDPKAGLGMGIVDQDLRSAALRLQAFMLRNGNLEEWQGTPPEKGLEAEKSTCTLSQKRLPPEIYQRIKAALTTPPLEISRATTIDKDADFGWRQSLRNVTFSSYFNSSLLERPFNLEPELSQMAEEFLTLYVSACDRTPATAATRQRLFWRMQMMYGPQVPFATIILSCLTASQQELQDKWPSTASIAELMRAAERSYYDKDPLIAAFENLLKLAREDQQRFKIELFQNSDLAEPEQKFAAYEYLSSTVPATPVPLVRRKGPEASGVQKVQQKWFETWHLFQQVESKERDSKSSWQEVSARLEKDQKEISYDPQTLFATQEIHVILQDKPPQPPTGQQILQYDALPNAIKKMHETILQQNLKVGAIESELLHLATKLPSDPLLKIRRESALLSGQAQSLNLSTLLLGYLKGDAAFYRKYNPFLTDEDIQQLHDRTEDYLIQATLQQQLKRAQTLMLKIDKIPVDQRTSKNSELLTQKLFATLQADRNYIPSEHPEYLVFEYSCDLLLYKDQVAQIDTLIDNRQWTILEILMGSGKTEILLPLVAFKKADKRSIPIIVLPDTLIQNFSPTIQRTLGTIFAQNLMRINWQGAKNKGITLAELRRIRQSLAMIPEQGSCLIVSQMDMHKLVLQSKRAKIEVAKTGSPEALQKWEEYQKILQMMKSQGQWLIDEVDLCLRPDFEMHQALDLGTPIDLTRTAISHLLYTTLLQQFPNISFDFRPQPGKQPCTPQLYAKQIQNKLTEMMLQKLVAGDALAREYSSEIAMSAQEIQTHCKAIEIYLKNPKADLPSELTLQTKNLLAFLRFQLDTLLPLTLHKLHGQNYGRFPEKGGSHSLLAGPYRLKDAPCLGSQFGIYGEQINYTFEAYLKEGPTPQDIQREITRLQNELQHVLALEGGSPSSTAAFKEFRTLFDPREEYDLMHIQPGQIGEIAKKLFNDPVRLLHFVRLVLDRTIRMPKQQITSTPSQILNLCASAKGMSGTVYANRKAFPQQFDDIRTAQGIHRKEIECIKRNNSILTLSSQLSGTDFLDALLKNDPKEKIKAIIDIGALLTGSSMQALATHLLQKRPALKAVIYYENDTAWILQRDRAPVPYTADFDKEIDPAQRFTIYDQKRCTGANIAQDPEAEAFVTLNKTQTFRDLAQGVWRMRGIEKGQQVHLVVTDEIRTIMGMALDKDPTTLDAIDLIDYTLRTQAQQQARNGVKRVKQQLRALFEDSCDALLKKVPSAQWHNEPYKSLVFLSISELQDNPYQQYGKPSEEVAAETVLGSYGQNLLDTLAAWKTKYAHLTQDLAVDSALALAREQLNRLVEGSIKEGVVPQKLKRLQGVDLEQEVTTEIEQEQEQEQEMELEQQQVYNNNQLTENRSLIWPEIDKLCRNGDFINTPLTEEESKEIRSAGHLLSAVQFFWEDFSLKEARPPILNANDALKQRPLAYQLLQDENLFSDDLIVSANLLYLEEGGEAFGPLQIPRTRCLVNQGAKKVQMLLLEPKNSDAVIREIGEKAVPDHTLALYDYTLGPQQAGIYATSKGEATWKTLSSRANFLELFVQYKFLCGELNGYSAEEVKALTAWLSKHRAKLGAIETVFKQVILPSDKRAGYAKSLMAKCFKSLMMSESG